PPARKAPLGPPDQPLEGLDERTYSRLLDDLPQLLKAFDATTLLVTHNRHEALRVAQDLVVLIDGRIRVAGDKSAVMMNPGKADVAEVLGYSVLAANGHRVAVPPRGRGPGGAAAGPCSSCCSARPRPSPRLGGGARTRGASRRDAGSRGDPRD